MGKQRLLFWKCHFEWCFRLWRPLPQSCLFSACIQNKAGSLHVYSTSCCTWLYIQKWSKYDINTNSHYSVILVWTIFCKRWLAVTLFIESSYVFLSTLIGSLHIFKNQCWVSVCISQWKSVSVQLLFDFCRHIVRFAVKFVVPLSILKLNLVMMNNNIHHLTKWQNVVAMLM